MNHLTDMIRLAVLPMDIKTGDKSANLRTVENAFRLLPAGTDIVVLPELFSTGFIDEADRMRELAESNTRDTVDFLKRLASEYSTAIAGSFLASTPPHIYNRAFFIEPSGDETFYDKHHLFSLGNESAILSPGREEKPVVRFRGWNVSLVVCYDIRFPVWCRARRLEYDILLVPSNWPDSRRYAWEHILIARAIENQCCVVGADRGGRDSFGEYDDMSRIYDCKGESVGIVSQGCPFITAAVSRSRQDAYRKAFPVSADADDFRLL